MLYGKHDKARIVSSILYIHTYFLRLIRLIGVCIEPNTTAVSNPVYIVMEKMTRGTLQQYIKTNEKSLTKTQLCRMCTDVCKVCDTYIP